MNEGPNFAVLVGLGLLWYLYTSKQAQAAPQQDPENSGDPDEKATPYGGPRRGFGRFSTPERLRR